MNLLQKYKKNTGTSLKIWILDIWESENLKISRSPVYLALGFLKFRNLKIWNFGRSEMLIIINDEFLKIMKSRRRGISWHYFRRRNFSKSLDMNLISIKKHESILCKNEPISVFSGKWIPITNQRTDSHPCIRFLHPMQIGSMIFPPLHPICASDLCEGKYNWRFQKRQRWFSRLTDKSFASRLTDHQCSPQDHPGLMQGWEWVWKSSEI